MLIEKMASICAIFSNLGCEDQSFAFGPDTIWIPWYLEDGDVAERLSNLGCSWDNRNRCWTY